MACLMFTFLLTTVFWIALAAYGLRRVLTNMKNPEAAEAITKHVLTPLFCKADKDKEPPIAEEDNS